MVNGNGHANNDIRLTHAAMPNWQRGGKQPLQGMDYVIVDPNTKIDKVPSQADFDLPNKESLLFGPMSKFRVEGTFQKLEENTTEWAALGVGDAAHVLLAPNWFEMLIKEVSVFHNNFRVASSSELRHITPFINAYLLHNMDTTAKNLLCPQDCHPAYCLPKPDGTWAIDQAAYTDYAKHAFKEGPINFDYTPLFMFPFYQGTNSIPRILPAPAMGRIQIRFAFTDSQDHIFRKKTPLTNKNKYRFSFKEFSLVLEEARLATPVARQLEHSKKPLAFPGVTRIQLVEQVPGSSTTYRTRFQDVLLPEGLFIFCLDKSVASGTYKFSTATNTKVFANHNISSVDMSFDGKRFSLREPHFGTFLRDVMDSKQLFDHLAYPPFGIRQNTDNLKVRNIADGFINTPFPHLYISLVNGPDRNRIIPALDDGSCINKKADFEIEFKFTEENAPANQLYCIFAFYTDINVIFDPKTRHFSSPYLQYMN